MANACKPHWCTPNRDNPDWPFVGPLDAASEETAYALLWGPWHAMMAASAFSGIEPVRNLGLNAREALVSAAHLQSAVRAASRHFGVESSMGSTALRACFIAADHLAQDDPLQFLRRQIEAALLHWLPHVARGQLHVGALLWNTCANSTESEPHRGGWKASIDVDALVTDQPGGTDQKFIALPGCHKGVFSACGNWLVTTGSASVGTQVWDLRGGAQRAYVLARCKEHLSEVIGCNVIGSRVVFVGRPWEGGLEYLVVGSCGHSASDVRELRYSLGRLDQFARRVRVCEIGPTGVFVVLQSNGVDRTSLRPTAGLTLFHLPPHRLGDGGEAPRASHAAAHRGTLTFVSEEWFNNLQQVSATIAEEGAFLVCTRSASNEDEVMASFVPLDRFNSDPNRLSDEGFLGLSWTKLWGSATRIRHALPLVPLDRGRALVAGPSGSMVVAAVLDFARQSSLEIPTADQPSVQTTVIRFSGHASEVNNVAIDADCGKALILSVSLAGELGAYELSTQDIDYSAHLATAGAGATLALQMMRGRIGWMGIGSRLRQVLKSGERHWQALIDNQFAALHLEVRGTPAPVGAQTGRARKLYGTVSRFGLYEYRLRNMGLSPFKSMNWGSLKQGQMVASHTGEEGDFGLAILGRTRRFSYGSRDGESPEDGSRWDEFGPAPATAFGHLASRFWHALRHTFRTRRVESTGSLLGVDEARSAGAQLVLLSVHQSRLHTRGRRVTHTAISALGNVILVASGANSGGVALSMGKLGESTQAESVGPHVGKIEWKSVSLGRLEGTIRWLSMVHTETDVVLACAADLFDYSTRRSACSVGTFSLPGSRTTTLRSAHAHRSDFSYRYSENLVPEEARDGFAMTSVGSAVRIAFNRGPISLSIVDVEAREDPELNVDLHPLGGFSVVNATSPDNAIKRLAPCVAFVPGLQSKGAAFIAAACRDGSIRVVRVDRVGGFDVREGDGAGSTRPVVVRHIGFRETLRSIDAQQFGAKAAIVVGAVGPRAGLAVLEESDLAALRLDAPEGSTSAVDVLFESDLTATLNLGTLWMVSWRADQSTGVQQSNTCRWLGISPSAVAVAEGPSINDAGHFELSCVCPIEVPGFDPQDAVRVGDAVLVSGGYGSHVAVLATHWVKPMARVRKSEPRKGRMQ